MITLHTLLGNPIWAPNDITAEYIYIYLYVVEISSHMIRKTGLHVYMIHIIHRNHAIISIVIVL